MALLRPFLVVVAFPAFLLLLRFAGSLPALAFGLLLGAAYVAYERFTRLSRAPWNANLWTAFPSKLRTSRT